MRQKFIFKDQKYKEKLKKKTLVKFEKNNSEDNENVKVKKKVDVLNEDINKEELNLERIKLQIKLIKKLLKVIV